MEENSKNLEIMSKGIFEVKSLIIGFSISFFLLIMTFLVPIFSVVKFIIRIVTFGRHSSCFIKAYNTYCCYKCVYLTCYFLNFIQLIWLAFISHEFQDKDHMIFLLVGGANFLLNSIIVVEFEFFYRKNMEIVRNDEQLFLHVL